MEPTVVRQTGRVVALHEEEKPDGFVVEPSDGIPQLPVPTANSMDICLLIGGINCSKILELYAEMLYLVIQ